MGKANSYQVGGDHYKTKFSPWDVVNDWGLGYLDGTALKYIARWRKKNGLEDIKKAIHFLEKLVEQETEEDKKLLEASKLVGQAFSNSHYGGPIGDAFPYHMALEQVQRDWVLEAEKQEKILKALAEDAEALGLHK
jgi:hypothetical protein